MVIVNNLLRILFCPEWFLDFTPALSQNFYFDFQTNGQLNIIIYVKIETTSASDQNSNMQFLSNEFYKIIHDLFTMT